MLGIWKQDIDNSLQEYIDSIKVTSKFQKAAHDMIPGGKRYRGILGLNVYAMLRSEFDFDELEDVDFMKSAEGFELIQLASLVYDDLPSQDNASFRKGMKTIHEEYNPATAELAGLYLKDLGLQLIIENISEHVVELTQIPVLTGLVFRYLRDLKEGQERDLRHEGQRGLRQDREAAILKTMQMKNNVFELVCVLPTYFLHQTKYLTDLEEVGRLLSVTYQLFDDLRDKGDSRITGKPTNQDAYNSVSVFGKAKVFEMVEQNRKRILEIFDRIGDKQGLSGLTEAFFSNS